jgi:hypothetical protein
VREIVGHGRSAVGSMIVVNTSARAEALGQAPVAVPCVMAA